MKPRVSIIVAVDEKNGIGKDNRIPWVLRPDLIRVKYLTLDRCVILGRKTYESMVGYYDAKGRQMPGKLYLVVTRDQYYNPNKEDAVSAHSLGEALEKADGREVYIMGGQQIFKEAIDRAIVDRLYLTQVQGDFDCDTFFPDYSSFGKKLISESGESKGLKYNFLVLDK